MTSRPASKGPDSCSKLLSRWMRLEDVLDEMLLGILHEYRALHHNKDAFERFESGLDENHPATRVTQIFDQLKFKLGQVVPSPLDWPAVFVASAAEDGSLRELCCGFQSSHQEEAIGAKEHDDQGEYPITKLQMVSACDVRRKSLQELKFEGKGKSATALTTQALAYSGSSTSQGESRDVIKRLKDGLAASGPKAVERLIEEICREMKEEIQHSVRGKAKDLMKQLKDELRANGKKEAERSKQEILKEMKEDMRNMVKGEAEAVMERLKDELSAKGTREADRSKQEICREMTEVMRDTIRAEIKDEVGGAVTTVGHLRREIHKGLKVDVRETIKGEVKNQLAASVTTVESLKREIRKGMKQEMRDMLAHEMDKHSAQFVSREHLVKRMRWLQGQIDGFDSFVIGEILEAGNPLRLSYQENLADALAIVRLEAKSQQDEMDRKIWVLEANTNRVRTFIEELKDAQKVNHQLSQDLQAAWKFTQTREALEPRNISTAKGEARRSLDPLCPVEQPVNLVVTNVKLPNAPKPSGATPVPRTSQPQTKHTIRPTPDFWLLKRRSGGPPISTSSSVTRDGTHPPLNIPKSHVSPTGILSTIGRHVELVLITIPATMIADVLTFVALVVIVIPLGGLLVAREVLYFCLEVSLKIRWARLIWIVGGLWMCGVFLAMCFPS